MGKKQTKYIARGTRRSNHRSRLFIQSFVQAQIKENIKAPHQGFFLGESTYDRWIPLTKGENVFFLWRHHARGRISITCTVYVQECYQIKISFVLKRISMLRVKDILMFWGTGRYHTSVKTTISNQNTYHHGQMLLVFLRFLYRQLLVNHQFGCCRLR